MSNINQLFPQHLPEVTFPTPGLQIRRNAGPNPPSKAGERLQERACPGHPCYSGSRYFRSEAASLPHSSRWGSGLGSWCPAYLLEPPGSWGGAAFIRGDGVGHRDARSPDPACQGREGCALCAPERSFSPCIRKAGLDVTSGLACQVLPKGRGQLPKTCFYTENFFCPCKSYKI